MMNCGYSAMSAPAVQSFRGFHRRSLRKQRRRNLGRHQLRRSCRLFRTPQAQAPCWIGQREFSWRSIKLIEATGAADTKEDVLYLAKFRIIGLSIAYMRSVVLSHFVRTSTCAITAQPHQIAASNIKNFSAMAAPSRTQCLNLGIWQYLARGRSL